MMDTVNKALDGDSDFNVNNRTEEILTSHSDGEFNTIIGCIEDIILDSDFVALQHYFLEKYWMLFENVEENKFIYMDIFEEYTLSVENHIEAKLCCVLPNFDIQSFITDLISRRNELDGEVFEMLFTLTDFNEFKEMFLDYRADKEGRVEDFSNSLYVTSYK